MDWVTAEAEDEMEADSVAEAGRLAVVVSDESAVPPRDCVSDGESDFEVVVELAENVPLLLVSSKDRDNDELPLATMMEPVPSAVKVVVGVP